MPTIAELIAAKNAAKLNPPPPPVAAVAPPAAKRESMAETMDLREAIDRIDAPGKRRPSPGLVLTRSPSPSTDELAPPTPVIAEPRALGARVGEALTVAGPTPQAMAWDEVLNRWETDLVIMADPEPGSESAWLALRPMTGGGLPVMLHRLPFWPHPARRMTEDEPF